MIFGGTAFFDYLNAERLPGIDNVQDIGLKIKVSKCGGSSESHGPPH
jgi:hypothetical protein